jgi:8-oxo-dGTP diphosphatase
VLDHDDRILLVHFDFADWTGWATPGGGVEPDESLEVAIRQELQEEVGLADVDLGPLIWERTHIFGFAEFSGQYEKFFLVRTSMSEINPSFSREELLAERLTAWRWWTLQEIRMSPENFAPSELASRLETLIAEGPPSDVVDVGV